MKKEFIRHSASLIFHIVMRKVLLRCDLRNSLWRFGIFIMYSQILLFTANSIFPPINQAKIFSTFSQLNFVIKRRYFYFSLNYSNKDIFYFFPIKLCNQAKIFLLFSSHSCIIAGLRMKMPVGGHYDSF